MKVIRDVLVPVARWFPIGLMLYLGLSGSFWRASESNLVNNYSVGFALTMLAFAYIEIRDLKDKVKALESRR